MNHHELLAGVPGVQRVMQAFARRVAGLGRLPGGVEPPRPASRRGADVLVVGAGAAGMTAALALARRGRKVEVVDDALEWGGSLRALPGAVAWQPTLASFGEAVTAGRITVRLRTTAGAVYGEDVLVAGEDGVEVVTPRTLILAPGAHDGVLAFEGNDVPGVMSARAAGWMLGRRRHPRQARGRLGRRRGGPFGEGVRRCNPRDPPSSTRAPLRAKGSGRVREAVFGSASLTCDALLLDVPRAPAYELCAQAGATLVPRGPWFPSCGLREAASGTASSPWARSSGRRWNPRRWPGTPTPSQG